MFCVMTILSTTIPKNTIIGEKSSPPVGGRKRRIGS